MEEFAEKCLKKLEEDEKIEENKAKVNNFLKRVEMYASAKEERMKALIFLEEKYDDKSRQLKFYPKINRGKATQKGRYWKDIDGMDRISEEAAIYEPN